jgi:hypothetical protein
VRAEHDAGRYARDRRERKRGHDRAGGGAASLDRNHIADDRHDDRAEYAAGNPCERPRGEQQMKAMGERTGKVRQREQRVHAQQQTAPVEAVDIGRREQSRQPGAPRIRGHRRRKRGRRDVERVHDLRAERHHHHKVHDDGELRERKQPQQTALVLRAD